MTADQVPGNVAGLGRVEINSRGGKQEKGLFVIVGEESEVFYKVVSGGGNKSMPTVVELEVVELGVHSLCLDVAMTSGGVPILENQSAFGRSQR